MFVFQLVQGEMRDHTSGFYNIDLITIYKGVIYENTFFSDLEKKY